MLFGIWSFLRSNPVAGKITKIVRRRIATCRRLPAPTFRFERNLNQLCVRIRACRLRRLNVHDRYIRLKRYYDDETRAAAAASSFSAVVAVTVINGSAFVIHAVLAEQQTAVTRRDQSYRFCAPCSTVSRSRSSTTETVVVIADRLLTCEMFVLTVDESLPIMAADQRTDGPLVRSPLHYSKSVVTNVLYFLLSVYFYLDLQGGMFFS